MPCLHAGKPVRSLFILSYNLRQNIFFCLPLFFLLFPCSSAKRLYHRGYAPFSCKLQHFRAATIGRFSEIVEMLERRQVVVCSVQEASWKESSNHHSSHLWMKPTNHLVAYHSGERKLHSPGDCSAVVNTKTFLEKECIMQHRLVENELRVRARQTLK